MKKKQFLWALNLFIVFTLFSDFVKAQHAPFFSEIQNFKKADSANFPPKNEILFVGSSSFRKWTDVQKYFPGYKIINRGFGGSTIPNAIYYADKIIFPYHPRQVVIYEGDNDLASSKKITADSVLNRFKTLFYLIRKNLPKTNIAFVSIKPSLSREKLMPEMARANTLIQNFLKDKKNAAFIDVFHSMLNKNGTPKNDIFLNDGLHMNAKGYAIWQKIIRPYLIKN
jgi:lysophospholipase L1-like esterase